MHYGDEKQLKESELIVVVYKHGTEEEDAFDYEIASIQSCKYFPPNLLRKILDSPEKYLGEHFSDQKTEEWYETTIISMDGYDEISILSSIVSESENGFHRLH